MRVAYILLCLVSLSSYIQVALSFSFSPRSALFSPTNGRQDVGDAAGVGSRTRPGDSAGAQGAGRGVFGNVRDAVPRAGLHGHSYRRYEGFWAQAGEEVQLGGHWGRCRVRLLSVPHGPRPDSDVQREGGTNPDELSARYSENRSGRSTSRARHLQLIARHFPPRLKILPFCYIYIYI